MYSWVQAGYDKPSDMVLPSAILSWQAHHHDGLAKPAKARDPEHDKALYLQAWLGALCKPHAR